MSEALIPEFDFVPYYRRQHDASRYGIPIAAVDAFDSQRRSAKRRGIPFLFTLPEWWSWWQIDDRWSQRGLSRDALVMARRGDTGPYSHENVYCVSHSQNARDGASSARAQREAQVVRIVELEAEVARLRAELEAAHKWIATSLGYEPKHGATPTGRDMLDRLAASLKPPANP